MQLQLFYVSFLKKGVGIYHLQANLPSGMQMISLEDEVESESVLTSREIVQY